MGHKAITAIGLLAGGLFGQAPRFFPDDPLMKEPRPRNVAQAAERKISDYYDFFHHTLATPGDLASKAKREIPAQSVNTLGEVPEGAWYASRHYFRPMTVAELRAGPGDSDPPSTEGSWLVLRGKTEGITPGIRIRDSKGKIFQLKFDPPTNPEMSSAADLIGSRIFHALGYHVPQTYLVHVERSQLVINNESQTTDELGRRRKMTGQDLADILLKASREGDGKYRAVASLFLPGQDIGPFRFYGTRRDDPNDIVPHEHRRELRGYRLFCAWVNHDDSRSINTIDLLTEEDGVKFIKHHLIDFGSILGSGSTMSNSPRSGNEYVFSWNQPVLQFFTFGLVPPKWSFAKFPKITSVGRLEWELFDAERWVPEYPNPAFLNMTDADGFWAARQVMAFTNEQISAIVKSAEYTDPKATEWVTKCLIERRNKIGKAYLTRVMPLDHFAVRDGELKFEDLAAKHKVWQPVRYDVEWATFDNRTGKTEPVDNGKSFRIPAQQSEYLVATIQYPDSPKSMKVYVRREGGSHRVVGIER